MDPRPVSFAQRDGFASVLAMTSIADAGFSGIVLGLS